MNLLDPNIEKYATDYSSPMSEACRELYDFTNENVPMNRMLIGPQESAFLKFLLATTNRKSILEIGTFTGFSALSMAEAIGDDATVLTLDQNEETTKLAKGFWDKSSAGKNIQSKVGNALELIDGFSKDEIFDFVFIDADKENYLNYFLKLEKHLSPGAIICADNTLWSGRVLDSDETSAGDSSTQGIKKFNNYIKENNDKYHCSLVTIRDGLFLITKKSK